MIAAVPSQSTKELGVVYLPHNFMDKDLCVVYPNLQRQQVYLRSTKSKLQVGSEIQSTGIIAWRLFGNSYQIHTNTSKTKLQIAFCMRVSDPSDITIFNPDTFVSILASMNTRIAVCDEMSNTWYAKWVWFVLRVCVYG